MRVFDQRPADSPSRLGQIRQWMAEYGLGALIVPREDAYLNEYLPADQERLAWLTGFKGAGLAVISSSKALLLTDGRYLTQAGEQASEGFEVALLDAERLVCLAQTLAGERVGYDPRLHSVQSARALADVLKTQGASLLAIEENPVDRFWTERPLLSSAPIVHHPLHFSGESVGDKRERLAVDLRRRGGDVAVIAAPTSVAWLFNIRGGDIPCVPVPLSRALLFADGRAELFVANSRLDRLAIQEMGARVLIRESEDFDSALAGLKNFRVLIDPAQANDRIRGLLEGVGAELLFAPDPCLLPKARKNAIELEGARRAHLRDGLALTRFLHWLDVEADMATLDELSIVARLQDFREDNDLYMGPSFRTIAGLGPHSAMPHYRPTLETNRLARNGDLLLLDSGGQYRDGTTDVTRTIVIGEAQEAERARYTSVLRGHIAMARLKFAPGSSGHALDAVARAPLWSEGLDFDHGVGHGVGSFLSVHEGPQRISPQPNDVALSPGMIVSNEPGYYLSGQFGVRIENLLAVEQALISQAERPMLGFETLTLAPLDRRLIVAERLSVGERRWVNDYHQRVAAALAPELESSLRPWLERACAPISGVRRFSP